MLNVMPSVEDLDANVADAERILRRGLPEDLDAVIRNSAKRVESLEGAVAENSERISDLTDENKEYNRLLREFRRQRTAAEAARKRTAASYRRKRRAAALSRRSSADERRAEARSRRRRGLLRTGK